MLEPVGVCYPLDRDRESPNKNRPDLILTDAVTRSLPWLWWRCALCQHEALDPMEELCEKGLYCIRDAVAPVGKEPEDGVQELFQGGPSSGCMGSAQLIRHGLHSEVRVGTEGHIAHCVKELRLLLQEPKVGRLAVYAGGEATEYLDVLEKLYLLRRGHFFLQDGRK